MTKRTKQEIKLQQWNDIKSDIPSHLKERWQPLALSDEQQEDINILDEIGDDWWSDSDTTLSRVNQKLRRADGSDITVNINSYGGSMFEGLAIYNALCLYKGNVTVNILGIAASAASLIAMAGDNIKISPSAFLMIHNSAVITYGNRHDLADIAQQLKAFDEAMASLYVSTTGQDKSTIIQMMDDETWLDGTTAVEKGFATELFEPKIKAAVNNEIFAVRQLDGILAKQGIPRSERRELINKIKGTQDATLTSTQDATPNTELLMGITALQLQLTT